MKKVALLTTHRANNFGAQLQTFALVKTLCECGVEAELLDWRTPHFEQSYHQAVHFTPRVFYSPKALASFILRIVWFWRYNKKITQLFDLFRGLYPISTKYETKESLSQVTDRYDLIVVGSDQVWNPHNTAVDGTKFDRTYLLDFFRGAAKKKAYAASIGVKVLAPESLIPEYKYLLSDFSVITVRERAGAELVEELIGVKPEVVVDPVLLRTHVFWSNYFDEAVQPEKPYVLLYNMHRSHVLRSVAIDYAKKNNLTVKELVLPSRPGQRWSSEIEPVFAGPRQFVTLVAHAEAIFTASFHASVFCLLFHRPLFVETRDLQHNSNSRMENLFALAGVKQDVVRVFEQNGVQIDRLALDDWERVDKCLAIERERSLAILKQMLI